MRPRSVTCSQAQVQPTETVRTECDRLSRLVSSGKRERFLTRRRVPDFHRAVTGRRGDAAAIGTEGHRGEGRTVSAENLRDGAGTKIPDPRFAVSPGNGKLPPVGAERQADGFPSVLIQGRQERPGIGVPQSQRVVDDACGGEPPSIGAERHASNRTRVSAHDPQDVSGERVANLHGVIPAHSARRRPSLLNDTV